LREQKHLRRTSALSKARRALKNFLDETSWPFERLVVACLECKFQEDVVKALVEEISNKVDVLQSDSQARSNFNNFLDKNWKKECVDKVKSRSESTSASVSIGSLAPARSSPFGVSSVAEFTENGSGSSPSFSVASPLDEFNDNESVGQDSNLAPLELNAKQRDLFNLVKTRSLLADVALPLCASLFEDKWEKHGVCFHHGHGSHLDFQVQCLAALLPLPSDNDDNSLENLRHNLSRADCSYFTEERRQDWCLQFDEGGMVKLLLCLNDCLPDKQKNANSFEKGIFSPFGICATEHTTQTFWYVATASPNPPCIVQFFSYSFFLIQLPLGSLLSRQTSTNNSTRTLNLF
jgi:hypothetical protein